VARRDARFLEPTASGQRCRVCRARPQQVPRVSAGTRPQGTVLEVGVRLAAGGALAAGSPRVC